MRGKSTVIQAIQLALTGNVDHPDAISEFIRRSSAPNPPKKARVKLDFEADGKKGSITRVITRNTNTRELIWAGLPDDVKSLTADKRVSDELHAILGVDKQAINSTVFIGQGEFMKMFGKDPARREFYTRLLMLGHLDGKIADVVDVYRKQIADSTQDLTAVKDAAETAHKQASEYYELCAAEFAAMVSPAADIAKAMELVGLFSRHASAEQAFTDAQTALQAATLAGNTAGRPVAEITAEREARADTLQKWLDAANLKRRTHAALTSAAATAHAAVKKTEDAARAFTALDKAQAALDGLPPQAAEDPRNQMGTLDGYLANFDAVDKLEAHIPDLELEVARCRREFDALETGEAAEIQTLWDASDSHRKGLVADLRLRESLQREMATVGEVTCCTLCGSSNPDGDYLEKSIHDLKLLLDLATTDLNAITTRRTQSIQKRAASENELLRQTVELERVNADLKRRKVMVSLVGPRDAVEARRVELEAAVSDYITATADRKRLNGEVLACQGEARLFDRPEAGAHERLVAAAMIADVELNNFPMDPELDQQEVVTIAELQQLQRTMAAYVKAQADYTAAESQRSVVEQEMINALEPIAIEHPLLHARLDGTGVLTSSTVTKAAEDMRIEQSAYDAQEGKTKAAQASANQAAETVKGITKKIAEQGERRKLAEDLTKIRDTFRPSGATIQYLEYKFAQIAEMASDYLSESQADFMVTASADIPLAFDFFRLDQPDQVWMNQNRASGGQKVRLAVAALRAIHALVMPNVGLLVLDEPTTHLDDDAVRSMAEMLKKIGDEGTLQMVVCDHNPVLIDAFSDIIEIPE